jgi:serine/threonine-protein kinase
MHTRRVDLQRLGTYHLESPLVVHRASSRLFLARHEPDPGGRDAQGDPGGPGPTGGGTASVAPFLIKILMPGRGDAEATLRAQFEHEQRLLQALNHPAIPTLHGHGEQDGALWLAMDYIDGVDLAVLLGHQDGHPRKLDKEVVVYVLAQLADALHHVHTADELDAQGEVRPLAAIHRDLCPANVLLSVDGDVLLSDFGTARSVMLPPEHDMTQAGHLAYMAPERLAGKPASVQTDLFALAAVAWEMLRGERLFHGDTEIATMDAIAQFDISQGSRRVVGLSPRLSEVVRRNLDRDPQRRHEDAYQVLQRLSQAAEARSAESARQRLAELVVAAKAARAPA